MAVSRDGSKGPTSPLSVSYQPSEAGSSSSITIGLTYYNAASLPRISMVSPNKANAIGGSSFLISLANVHKGDVQISMGGMVVSLFSIVGTTVNEITKIQVTSSPLMDFADNTAVDLEVTVGLSTFTTQINVIGYRAKVLDFSPTECESGKEVDFTIRLTNFNAGNTKTVVMFGGVPHGAMRDFSYQGNIAILRVRSPALLPGSTMIQVYPGNHTSREAMVVAKDGSMSSPTVKVTDATAPQIASWKMASGETFAYHLGGGELLVFTKNYPRMRDSSELQVTCDGIQPNPNHNTNLL